MTRIDPDALRIDRAHKLYQHSLGTHHEAPALELLRLAVLAVQSAQTTHNASQRVYVEGSFEAFAAEVLK